MNFLGHLYFSENDYPIMLANLYGDFVKGRLENRFPPVVYKGLVLHRKIDDFIDSHSIVKDLSRSLYNDLPKVSSIAIDLYFDHLLALHWSKFHKKNFFTYVDDFFRFALNENNYSFEGHTFEYDQRFLFLLHRIYSGRWIHNYDKREGLNFACNGISQRLSFHNSLNLGVDVFLKHEKYITSVFWLYMKDAQNEFLSN